MIKRKEEANRFLKAFGKIDAKTSTRKTKRERRSIRKELLRLATKEVVDSRDQWHSEMSYKNRSEFVPH